VSSYEIVTVQVIMKKNVNSTWHYTWDGSRICQREAAGRSMVSGQRQPITGVPSSSSWQIPWLAIR